MGPKSAKPSASANKAKKRSHEETSDTATAATTTEDQPPTKKHKDDQQAKSGSLTIAADPIYESASSSKVYIGDDGTIYDATLNQTNASKNNNKFYVVQLLVDNTSTVFHTYTRWGRVGETGTGATLGDGSLASATDFFNKKFKDKSGLKWEDRHAKAKPNKYTFLQKTYEEDSSSTEDGLPGAQKRRASKETISSSKSTESKLPGAVQRLMDLIFNQDYFATAMAQLEYDSDKQPLGQLSKKTLRDGYQVLKELAELIRDPSIATNNGTSFMQAVENYSNQYLSYIPHVIRRGRRPPIIHNEEMLRREIELLENLTDMQLSSDIMKDAKGGIDGDGLAQIDRQYHGLGMAEMTPLPSDSAEYQQLQEYLIKCAGQTHHIRYRVEDIFRIKRSGEDSRFQKSAYSGLVAAGKSDRRLLWHGSRSTNFGGILSQGLRIAPPEAPANGYMFGKGVYLADMSTKSANYCAASASGNIGLLLLCEAELGKPMHKLTNANYSAAEDALNGGSLSTWGVGMTAPNGWRDAGSVHEKLTGVTMPDVSQAPVESKDYGAYNLLYNEYICYDVKQIRQRYLFRVQML